MEVECLSPEDFPQEEALRISIDVAEPDAQETENVNEDINTTTVDMLQEHEYDNEDGSVDLAPEMNVDENTILLPAVGENGMNADDPAIAFIATDFLQEEEQVVDPMDTNTVEPPPAPTRSRRTPSQVPKKRRDAMPVKFEADDDYSSDKRKKRRGRKPGSKVVNGQVFYPNADLDVPIPKSSPKVKGTPKSTPRTVKREGDNVKDNQCRVCMSKADLVNVFKKEYTKTYAEKLMALCPVVSIQRKDFLPQFICGICVSSVNAAFALKAQCEQTDAELRNRLEKSIKKVHVPVSKAYIPPDSEPDDFPDPSKDQDFKLSDASPASVDDSDSDYEKPLAKRRTLRRTRNTSTVIAATPKAIKSKPEKKPPTLAAAIKKEKSTSPVKKAIKPEPDLNASKSSDADLDAGGFSTGSEENYSPPKKRRPRDTLKSNERGDSLTCRICSETMATKEALKEHKKVMHSDYECKLCGRKFRVQSSLKAHMDKHTKSSELKCEHCEKHFPNKTERRKHLIDVHKKPPTQFICEKCNRAFTSEVRLIKHNESRCPGFDMSHAKKNKVEIESLAMGKDLFKCVAPLTTTYWSDSFSD